MGTENQKAKCCHIHDAGQALLKQPGLSRGDERMIIDRHGCKKDAEWEISDTAVSPDSVTHACTEHVGELLSDGWHYVYPMPDYSKLASERIGATVCDPNGERRCAACFSGVGQCTAMGAL